MDAAENAYSIRRPKSAKIHSNIYILDGKDPDTGFLPSTAQGKAAAELPESDIGAELPSS
jgi:hypothetical protein